MYSKCLCVVCLCVVCLQIGKQVDASLYSMTRGEGSAASPKVCGHNREITWTSKVG